MPTVPIVSICLPVFNGEAFLAEAIESALGQSFEDFELVIRDDMSGDSSWEIAARYAAGDSRIRLDRNESRLGLFANYNACIEAASGEFVKPFAQDDLLAPEILERMVAAFRSCENISLITCARDIIDETGVRRELVQRFSEDTELAGEDATAGNLLAYENWLGEPSCVMFPRSLAGSGFDCRYCHYGDLEYWIRILQHGSLLYLAEPLCSFRRHPGSTTSRNLRSLNFIADLERLAVGCQELLGARGVSYDSYWSGALAVISRTLFCLNDEGGMDEPSVDDIESMDESEVRAQLALMRRVAFRSLVRLSLDAERASAARHELEGELFELEEKLSSSSGRRSWSFFSI